MTSSAKHALFQTLKQAEENLQTAIEAAPLSPKEWSSHSKPSLSNRHYTALERLENLTSHLQTQSAEVLHLKNKEEIKPTLSTLLEDANKQDDQATLYHGENPFISAFSLNNVVKTKLYKEELDVGKRAPDVFCALSTAIAAASETGTLFLTASQANPTALNFVSNWHIVLLNQADIFHSYEQAYEHCLNESKIHPQTINMISGPSRTADIEQTLTLGAHGPIKLTVIIYE